MEKKMKSNNTQSVSLTSKRSNEEFREMLIDIYNLTYGVYITEGHKNPEYAETDEHYKFSAARRKLGVYLGLEYDRDKTDS
jgi:hypothetical protein